MWLPLLLVSFVLFQATWADTCQSCVAAGHSWCVETSKCQPLTCKTSIKNALNCPTAPQTGYEYTDDFGRNVALPIIVAAGIHDPMTCLKNAIPTSALDKIVDAPCAYLGPNVSCHVYTAYDTVQKLIIVSFRGTDGSTQLFEEFESFLEQKEPFFDSGHVYKYFYDAFMLLWRQGLESSVRNLKYLYPNFDVWVMGHSLGGALASVCSSYMLKIGLATPDHLRLVTFGQPRTGDKDWAQWHDATFLYSYRIVHHKDIVPHIPPRGGPDEVWHHRFEIWYNNAMAVGDPYQICAEDDGLYCSNTQADLSTADHGDYYRPNMYGSVNVLAIVLVFSSFSGLLSTECGLSSGPCPTSVPQKEFTLEKSRNLSAKQEKRSVSSGEPPYEEKNGQEKERRLGIGIGLGFFALLIVASTVYWTTRKTKTAKKTEKEPKSPKAAAKPVLWRRRRERRTRRHLNDRLKKPKRPKSASGGTGKTRHLTSRYANPKNNIAKRKTDKETMIAAFFRKHRMRRCARRATARERARVRLHSRAHDRKLRDLKKMAKQSRPPTLMKAEGPGDTRLNVDCQRRLKSKFAAEELFPQSTKAEYWKEKLPITSKEGPKKKEKLPIPSKEGQGKGKAKTPSKEKAKGKSKEIMIKEVKTAPVKEGFLPDTKKLDSLVKKLPEEMEDKLLKGDGKKGADFNWPISLEMMYEQLPAEYPNAAKLEEMIVGWAQLGVFRLETQVRAKRPTATWDYATVRAQEATTSPSRVKLNTEKWLHESDWINASYFGLPDDDRQRFICSPAPDKTWDYDFWTMLLDHDVKCIVQMNNWDYQRPVMDQKDYFIPFEKQHYVSSQSKTVRIPKATKKNFSNKDKGSKTKGTATPILSQIDEYTKHRKNYKLGRGRKREQRNLRRRLSEKRRPVVKVQTKGGGKPRKSKSKKRKSKSKMRSSRNKGGGEKKSMKAKGSVEKKETKTTSMSPKEKEIKTTPKEKEKKADSKEKDKKPNSNEKEKGTIESTADRRERRKAKKLRRKLRRGMRRIGEDGGRPEIFIRKLSVCYLFPHPSTQDTTKGLQLSVKPCQHTNGLSYWRIAAGIVPDDGFLVRATLLRVLCRKRNVNYKLVHFQVFNLEPYQSPDFTRYKCLIQLVNKIAGTVSVVSEDGMSRGPAFCLSAILLQQLKAGELPDPLELYAQMQASRPGCMLRPYGFFVALRTMLEYVKQHQKHFKQKDSLDKLLADVKVALALQRF